MIFTKLLSAATLVFTTCFSAFLNSASNAVLPTAVQQVLSNQAVCEGVRFRESELYNRNLHKYYLSVSNVTYSTKAKALQMTTRFFIDDLENTLSQETDTKLVINTNKDLANLKAELTRYLSKKIEISTDGTKRTIDYLGGEVDNDQVVLYIEIPAAQEPSAVKMKFTALQEMFEDQKNMVHFKLNGKRGTLLMTKEKPTDILKLS